MMVKQIDVLRVIAALSIVMIHVTSGQVLADPVIFGANQLARFASPMFVIVAGMVLMHVEMHRPSPGVAAFYRRRFMRVLVPYVIWSLVYFLYTSRHLILYEANVAGLLTALARDFPVQLVKGTAFVHLYFILIMVQLYALFPLMKLWLERRPGWLLAVTGISAFLLNAAVYLHQINMIRLPTLYFQYVVLFPVWWFYFALGMAVVKHADRWQARVLRPRAYVAAAVVWLAVSSLYLYDSRHSGTYAASIGPMNMLYALVSFVTGYQLVYGVKWKPSRLRARLEEWVGWLAAASFLIYLVHPLVLNVLVKISVIAKRGSVFYGIDGLLLLYACTLALTLAAVAVINRLPLATWLGAAKRSRARYAPERPAAERPTAEGPSSDRQTPSF
jgi:surface polysaccharide O-acyltransferase-like enzyme